MADVEASQMQPVSPNAEAVGPEVQVAPTEGVQPGAYRPNAELVNELAGTENVPLYTMESRKCCGLYKWTVDFYPTCLVMFRERKDGQGKVTVMPKYQIVGYECRTKTFPKWIAVLIPLIVWILIFMFHPVYGKDGWQGDCPIQECDEGTAEAAENTCDRYDIPWKFSSPKEMTSWSTTLPPPTPEPTPEPTPDPTPEPTPEPPTQAPTIYAGASTSTTTTTTSSTTTETEDLTAPSCGPGSSKDGHSQMYECCVHDYGPGPWIALQVVFLILLGVPVIAWFFIRTPPDWCHVRLHLRNTGWVSWFFSEHWSPPLWLAKEPDHAFLRQYIFGALQPKIEEYHALNHLKRNNIRAFPTIVSSERLPVVQVVHPIDI